MTLLSRNPDPPTPQEVTLDSSAMTCLSTQATAEASAAEAAAEGLAGQLQASEARAAALAESVGELQEALDRHRATADSREEALRQVHVPGGHVILVFIIKLMQKCQQQCVPAHVMLAFAVAWSVHTEEIARSTNLCCCLLPLCHVQELSDLERRAQAAVLRHQELSAKLPEATAPLLRQITALQDAAAAQVRHFRPPSPAQSGCVSILQRLIPAVQFGHLTLTVVLAMADHSSECFGPGVLCLSE